MSGGARHASAEPMPVKPPPSSLRSAPYGAQSDPLPTDPAGPRRSPDLSAAPDRAPSPNGRRRSRTRSRLTRTLRTATLVLTVVAALLGFHESAHAETDVPLGWSLIPSGLSVGDKFRLIFITSTTRDATSSGIGDYNVHVQTAAQAGHTDIQSYKSGFRVVASTSAKDARDNTSTTGTGVAIYWLNGNKVADNYGDFYDGSWDDETNPTNESGTAATWKTALDESLLFTGSNNNGTKHSSLYLGNTTLSTAVPGTTDQALVGQLNDDDDDPIHGGTSTDTSTSGHYYALSDVFHIVTTTPGAPTSLTVGTVTPSKIPLSWTAPSFTGGASITSYTVERAPNVAGEPGTWATVGTVTTTSYTDTGLTADTLYWYRVSATNSEGTGSTTGADAARTNALPVVTIAATHATRSEGRSVDFDLTLDGDTSELTSVNLRFEPTGDFLSGGQTSAYDTDADLLRGRDDGTQQHGDRQRRPRRGKRLAQGHRAHGRRVHRGRDGVGNGGHLRQRHRAERSRRDRARVGHQAGAALGQAGPRHSVDQSLRLPVQDHRRRRVDMVGMDQHRDQVTSVVSMYEFQISGLTNGTDYTAEVRARSVAGIGAAGSGNSTPTPPAMITGVAITSDPGNDDTYAIGEDIVFTLTFNKALSIDGTDTTKDPGYITYHTDYASDDPSLDDPEAACVVGADTMTLVCTDTIVEGEYDTDGISVNANSLSDFGSISAFVGPNLQRVSSTFAGLPADSDHKIDGIRPTLSSADADQNDLTKIILTFSEAVKSARRHEDHGEEGRHGPAPVGAGGRSTRWTRRRSWSRCRRR